MLPPQFPLLARFQAAVRQIPQADRTRYSAPRHFVLHPWKAGVL